MYTYNYKRPFDFPQDSVVAFSKLMMKNTLDSGPLHLLESPPHLFSQPLPVHCAVSHPSPPFSFPSRYPCDNNADNATAATKTIPTTPQASALTNPMIQIMSSQARTSRA